MLRLIDGTLLLQTDRMFCKEVVGLVIGIYIETI